MPETLDPFVFAIGAACEAADEDRDFDDDETLPTLREYLASTGETERL